MAKGKITSVEELAVMTQREFVRMDKRLTSFEEKVDRLDGKADQLGRKIDDGFKSVVGLLRVIEEDREKDTTALQARLEHLEKRVTRLEERHRLAA